MQSSTSRPLGPRNLHRPASPAPVPALASVAPLNIRKPAKPDPASLLAPPSPPASRSPTPKLGLRIPSAAAAAPAHAKPSLKLAISLAPPAHAHNARPQDDSPSDLFAGGYYGGPPLSNPPVNTDGTGETTIRPSSHASKALSMDDLRRTLSDIESHTASAPAPLSTPGEEQHDKYAHNDWSDDVFDEIARLGEGAGGAVHEVKDRRTGVVMARKTITTREAPMKQLLRELAIITTITHINIIHFYGAYMSPSSSEVKVVMEVCEGKSLEAVGKRIKERGARVGEKVAGRLAEGVRPSLLPSCPVCRRVACPHVLTPPISPRSCRASPISTRRSSSTVT